MATRWGPASTWSLAALREQSGTDSFGNSVKEPNFADMVESLEEGSHGRISYRVDKGNVGEG
jgi:hypothetical protein